ncbi:O-antigen ligase family protein [Pseudoxanthomonas sp. LjRoot125]|uniref:O-antigen ligase family protein n=1 Tax=Pseudoxanthomonas sp. LjRoot125 TaxID=3342258 RepID=UPI003E11BE44
MTADLPPTPDTPARRAHGWRWAPAWVLTFVALWPAPGYAEAVMVLGALAAIVRLLLGRFRGGTRLLSGAAWALTSALFAAYWLPQAISAIDAVDVGRALREAAVDLRYLPFLWLVAASVANTRARRTTFSGLAVIVGIWTLDALAQVAFGTSPLFWGLDQLKQWISGRPMCTVEQMAGIDRLSGFLGPCNRKLGVVMASLSPFLLFAAAARLRVAGWLLASAAIGVVVLLAGARAAWITYALVLVFSGWKLLGWKRLLGVFGFGFLLLGVLTVASTQVRERILLTTHALTADEAGVDTALSGRAQIWSAATCMIAKHPINGVGARGFRQAYPDCDASPASRPAWGQGPAFHAHQLVLEVLSETGVIGLLLWLAGAALAWRAWRYASQVAKERARPAMLALAVTVFPFNTHLAFYSTFWGGLTLMLAALYAGSLLARDDE